MGAENDTGIIRGHSTKSDKQKRQSPKAGNWRHAYSVLSDCRLTSRILPVAVRKRSLHEKGFF